MNITKWDDGSIFENQYAYAQKILARFNCDNLVSTPSDKCYVSDDADRKLIEKEIPYRQAVGSLMYLAIATRLDMLLLMSPKILKTLAHLIGAL